MGDHFRLLPSKAKLAAKYYDKIYKSRNDNISIHVKEQKYYRQVLPMNVCKIIGENTTTLRDFKISFN